MRSVERERQAWTKQCVEASLVAAFRKMPSFPVFSSGTSFYAAGAEDRDEVTGVLAWAALLEHDPVARKSLWAWARCRATRSSFGELCAGMGWPRATVEAARRRGATAIAQALNERANRLDSGNANVMRLTT